MVNYFLNLNHILQALIATLFTFGVTALGALIVVFFKKISKNFMDAMLGLSGGVMVAASFWSLLSPAISMAESLNMKSWLIVSLGFLSGGILLFIGDKLFDKIEVKRENKNVSSMKRCLMLIFSITLHNIPEGLAVGVVLAGIIGGGISNPQALLVLALGIAIQNFPEGMIVSLPLKEEGMSKWKAFGLGALSGVVEPIASLIALALTALITTILPYTLAFAAGVMIYVVVEELIPEASHGGHSNLGTIGFTIGFILMMILEILLG